MRLAIDIRCLQDKYWTGVADYTWNIINELNNHERPVDLLYYANCWRQKNNLPDNIKNGKNLIITHYPNKLQNFLLRYGLWKNLDQLMANHGQKPDIFWLPNLHFYKLSHQIKKVLTIHDLSFIHFPQFFSKKKRWWYLAAMKKLLKNKLNDFDTVIAVSNHTKNDLVSLYPDIEKKIKVVWSGVGNEFFVPPSQAEIYNVAHEYDLPKNFLLSVSTIEPRKNHILLLKAYEQILSKNPDFIYDLIMVGSRGWLWQPVIKHWKNMKHSHRVHFVGFVPIEVLKVLYSKAKLFLYPSLYEGFGFPPLEAMAVGTPCLVSSSSSLPEIVEQAAILLDPWVVDEWVETILMMVDNEALRQKYIYAGQQQAQKFSWKTAAAQTHNLFIKLL
ncbi:MAG: glycosyltransferase family 1 protein [Patescibacteria group bacterium]